jgi:pyruvate kinase
MLEPMILVTLGPSSLNKEFITYATEQGVYLFRINMSHTPINSLEKTIGQIMQWTDIPICIDSEGAQIRNHTMIDHKVSLSTNSEIKIHYDEIIGDSCNISFNPLNIARSFRENDKINVDFDSVSLEIKEVNIDHCIAIVKHGGIVGSNKAADVNRELDLQAITEKDKKAILIAKKFGIKHFALSFTNSEEDVQEMRQLVGRESCIISKIESKKGIRNLSGILDVTDQILIDRGDLSRQIALEKIPFLQRRIISIARSKGKNVHVATNLLESVIKSQHPTRAEVNDVVSTLIMGGNGLVLAAETAIGKYPKEAVFMIKKLIDQYKRWTPNSSIDDILGN